ncbi:SBBP repeat-containing protein [Spirulina sp. 06S082]|uniref:SBBP repeat-containing protein n=1 Tax=Spirulina sp. 06S082 TaxID=3110248 RepID=UPI002B20AA04|nr:SBBP repeat-containing protein [Spirulina sp. 06S082]MEA5469756.1 SBBP repeat-containing protein [Spirulina sp. 06S082]
MSPTDRAPGLEVNWQESNLSYLNSGSTLLKPLNFSSRSSSPLPPPPNGVAPSNLRFSLDNTSYSANDTIALQNGWIYDGDGGTDIARLDLQLLQGNTAIGEVRSFSDFAIATWDYRWANFNAALNLTDWGALQGGTYSLQATAYDRFGNASTPFSRTFLVEIQQIQNTAPTHFRFGLESSQYSPNAILKLMGGWVYDADGAADLAEIDLQIQDGQGTILHETNISSFTPASWANNWASFNDDIDLSHLGLGDGNYVIKGIASDRAGANSEEFSRNFAIASPANNEAPSYLSFGLSNNSYSDRDTLDLRHGWVRDGNGVDDLDKIEWEIWQGGTQIAALDDVSQFIPATWDNFGTWASFSYNVELVNLGLDAGEYSLRGIAYDRAGETSTPFERKFILESINTAPTLLFNLDRAAISPTETLSITGGFVRDEEGLNEVEEISFNLLENNSLLVNLGTVNSFTSSSEDNRWGSFNIDFDVSNLGLVAGEYKLQGIARDRAGKESEIIERIFTITPSDSGNNSSELELAWAKAIGGLGDQNGIDIEIDSEGNSYIVGTFPNTVDFDPGNGIYNLSSNGGKDVYVAKLDAGGNFLWAKALGGIGDDWAGEILLDSQNNIYIKGIFQNTVDFDPGNGIYNLSSLGSADSFVLKLDNAGNFLWAKNWNATESSSGGSIVLDSQDSLYVLGNFEGAIDTGSGALTSAGSKDLFISKLDRDGNFLWTKTTGGSSVEEGYDITLDRQGNIYLTGLFAGTADFDPSAGVYELTTPGFLYDSFVVKLDGQGNFIWARGTESPGFNYSTRIAVDSQGGVYSLGIFAGTLDFASGSEVYNLTSQSEVDIYVWKLDASGDLQWVKQAGNSDINLGTGIEIDRQDNIYITGLFNGTADFDPGTGVYNLTSAGDADAFIWTLDRDGNLQWAKNMGGSGADLGSKLAIGDRGEVYLIGGFENTGDFDPGDNTFTLTSPDAISIFVTKLQPASNTPISVDFNLNKTAYNISQTLTISSGNVSDRDGISDLSHIDFRLRHGDGSLTDLSDVTNFTSSTTDNRQGFFNYNLNLGALALAEGNYSLWAVAYDRSGTASEVFEQNFIISEIPDFDPTSLSFALSANSYLDTDTLSLDSGEVFDLNGAIDIARIDFQLSRPDGTLLDVGDAGNFVARSKDNRWADFSYNLDLNALNLTSGGYSLEGIAYDSAGGESRYFAQRFQVIPSNTAPTSLQHDRAS